MDYKPTQENLDRLKKIYNILNNIDLKIPNKNNTLSRLPRRYVTLYLKYAQVYFRESRADFEKF